MLFVPLQGFREAGSPSSRSAQKMLLALLPGKQKIWQSKAETRGGRSGSLLVIFQPLFWFWPFCCFQTKNIPWYKCPRLVRGSQDKVSPVCPTDPRRFPSFLRVTMEGTAFSDHHCCPVSAQQLSLPRTPQALHCHRVFLLPDRVSHNCALFVV